MQKKIETPSRNSTSSAPHKDHVPHHSHILHLTPHTSHKLCNELKLFILFEDDDKKYKSEATFHDSLTVLNKTWTMVSTVLRTAL